MRRAIAGPLVSQQALREKSREALERGFLAALVAFLLVIFAAQGVRFWFDSRTARPDPGQAIPAAPTCELRPDGWTVCNLSPEARP